MDINKFFSNWPFQVVPDPGGPMVWAGRPELRERVAQFLRAFSFRPQSTIDIVWAAFGSGKTHLLYYIKQQALACGHMIPWYVTTPESARTFVEMYSNLMTAFPFEAMGAEVLSAVESRRTEFDIVPVVRALVMGSDEQKSVAFDWFRGMRVDLRSARKLISLPYKIESSDQMQRIFSQVARALVLGGSRVLLLIDEYQRTQAHHSNSRELLNGAILDIFNTTPKGLSIIFSCSSAQQAKVFSLLSPELIDRMKGRPAFAMPVFSHPEAMQFMMDLLSAYRPDGYKGSHSAPFSHDALEAVVKVVENQTGSLLIPRHLIQVLDAALGVAIEEKTADVSHAQVLKIASGMAGAAERES